MGRSIFTFVGLMFFIQFVTSQRPNFARNEFDVLSVRKDAEKVRDLVKGLPAETKGHESLVKLYSAFSNHLSLTDGYLSLADTLMEAAAPLRVNVSGVCLKHFNQTLLGLLNGEMWALRSKSYKSM